MRTAAHDGADLGLDRAEEGRVVHLPAGALIDHFVAAGALRRAGAASGAGERERRGERQFGAHVGLLVVVHVVLGVGDHALGLDAAHDRLHELIAEVRVLAAEEGSRCQR